MTVNALPWGPKPQFVDANGDPMSGGTLQTLAAGSSTPQVTYTDSTGGTGNPTTITLNVRGESPNEVWLTAGLSYKLILKDSAGVTVWTVDNVAGVNDVSGSLDEWKASAVTPTFVSGTSFTLPGDQTVEFHKSRRLKTTNSGGTVYSTITSSVFAPNTTTVTVVNDSGNLDAGLSSVSYGIVRATNPSVSPDAVTRKGASVTSGATTDIWSIAGDYVHVTGTTTITSFGTAPYAGAQRTIIFDGALTLTHNATSLVLPGAGNIFTAANDRAVVRADTTANMVVVEYVRAAGTPVVGSSVPRSYLAGLTMSTAGSSATMTIAAGQATDSTNAAVMNLAASISKTTSAWAVGSASGGLDTGAIANSTWYHFYEIMRPDTGVVDVLFSTSASAPTMPTNYTLKRRIGSGKTDGSAQWIAFTQDGDYFRWAASVSDINAGTPGTAAVLRTLTVPTGVNVFWIGNAVIESTTAGTNLQGYFSDPSANDEAPTFHGSAPGATMEQPGVVSTGGANEETWAMLTIRTNTSAQVRTRLSFSDGNTAIAMVTLGWTDRRGRDA